MFQGHNDREVKASQLYLKKALWLFSFESFVTDCSITLTPKGSNCRKSTMNATNVTGRGRGRGGAGPTGPAGFFLNPERVPQLAPKYANKLGKTISKICIEWSDKGQLVKVETYLDGDGDVAQVESVSLAEFHRRLGEHNAPDESEKLRSLRRKFELRLNKAFPASGPASGKDADIQAWLDTLPFSQRRALLMSQKDFERSYPTGFRD